jgi:hypothetical protein
MLKTKTWRPIAIMFAIALIAAFGMAFKPSGLSAKPAPSPSESPTAVPTPFMPLDEVPNGSWDVIEQTYTSVIYSKMTLKESGDTITGSWIIDKNTVYALVGSRQGAHLTLQIMSKSTPDATVLGKMDADIDGIADMIGLITLGTGDPIAFQGAQHGRVPPPVDAGTPAPEQSPF